MDDTSIKECFAAFQKGLKDERLTRREQGLYDAVILASRDGERSRVKAEEKNFYGPFAFAGAFLAALGEYSEHFGK